MSSGLRNLRKGVETKKERAAHAPLFRAFSGKLCKS